MVLHVSMGGGFQMEGFIFKWGRSVPWWELVLIGGGGVQKKS